MKAELDQALCVAVGEYLSGITMCEGRTSLSTPRIAEISGWVTEDRADGTLKHHIIRVGL